MLQTQDIKENIQHKGFICTVQVRGLYATFDHYVFMYM